MQTGRRERGVSKFMAKRRQARRRVWPTGKRDADDCDSETDFKYEYEDEYECATLALNYDSVYERWMKLSELCVCCCCCLRKVRKCAESAAFSLRFSCEWEAAKQKATVHTMQQHQIVCVAYATLAPPCVHRVDRQQKGIVVILAFAFKYYLF